MPPHRSLYRAEVVPAGTVLVTRYVESVEYSVPRIAAAQQARLVPLSAAKSMGKSKSEGALEVPHRPQELAQAVGRPSVSAHGPSPFRKSSSLAAITRLPEQRQSRTAPKLENMRGFEMKTFASAVELKVDDGAMGAIASKLNLRDMARSRRQKALATEVERLTVERMQERYDKLRASTADAASRCDWRAMNDAISEQISMARKRDAAPLYASRSFCCRKSSLLPQSLVDASYAVSRAPHSPVGFYRRSAALAEQALQAATLDKRLEKRGDAGEALLESLSRAGLPGPAVDKAGFSDIEVPLYVGDYRDVQGNRLPSRFGDMLGAIRRDRRFYQSPKIGARGSRLPELCHHGLSGRFLVDSGSTKAVQPGPCPTPIASSVSTNAVTVTWMDNIDDGGDDIFRYELQWAELDLIDESATPVWQDGYSGLQKRSKEFSKLADDADYAFRLAATNAAGQGPWSEVMRVTTLPKIAGDRHVAPLPVAWIELERHIGDMLEPAIWPSRIKAHAHWESLVQTMREGQITLKIAYRFYSLLGSGVDGGSAMDLTQFRRFVDECGILTPAPSGGIRLSTATVKKSTSEPHTALWQPPVSMRPVHELTRALLCLARRSTWSLDAPIERDLLTHLLLTDYI